MKMFEKDSLIWEIETAQGKSKSGDEYDLWQKVLNKLAQIAVVDAEPLKCCHWVVGDNAYHRDDDGAVMDACIEATGSRCGRLGQDNFHYCPWCGAKSEGVV